MSKDNKPENQEIIPPSNKVPPKESNNHRFTGEQKPASRKNLLKKQPKYSTKTYLVKRIKNTPYECYVCGFVLSVPAKAAISKVPARIIEHPEFEKHKSELLVVEEK